MERRIWKQNLSKNYCPAWTCPACGKGNTTLVPNSLVHEETVSSKRSHGHEGWEPEWMEYNYTAWARCNNQKCKQAFSISGTSSLEPAYGEEGETIWEEYFVPHHVHPMPEIIVIPKKCPDDVTQHIHSAFKLLRSDRAACAGRIRVALECLMTHLGVQKKKKAKKKGTFYDLSLHARIEIYAKGNKAIGAELMAIKLLGNSGSHSEATVSLNDLLDALEVLEHALDEIIHKRSDNIKALVKNLTKKHGK